MQLWLNPIGLVTGRTSGLEKSNPLTPVIPEKQAH